MIINDIDNGNAFEWGNTSEDYAKYRDIYPQEFYQTILDLGLCKDGQHILDIGTGTGVLPRNMYRYGAKWVGTDITEKFKTKDLDEKYEKKATKQKATDLFTAKRRIDREEKEEIDLNNMGDTTLQL